MFLLSIINIPLSRDSDGNTLNNTQSVIAAAEQRVKDLEALYTTMLTGIIIDKTLYFNPIPGVDYGNLYAVKEELNSSRSYVLSLINAGQSGTEDAVDQQARINEMEMRDPVYQTRLNDLQSLYTALSNSTTLTDAYGKPRYISAVDNTNIYAVQREIDKVIAYGNELTSTKDFWTQVLNARMKANMQGDLNFDGKINNDDFLTLQDGINGNIQLNDAQKKAGDMNGDNVLSEEDLTILDPNFVPSTRTTPPVNPTPSWLAYTGGSNELTNFDSLKMDVDISIQKFMTEQRVTYLESHLNSLQKQSPTEELQREITQVQQELNREKLKAAMLENLNKKS